MSNATTFVGLDVHARSVKACAFVPETGETIRKSFGYEPGEIASWVSSLPQPARCVYESGVTGFHLCRELNAMGAACVIGAVSKMHKPAADRGRKTDRRDAQLLAVQLALGVVTEVHVPDAECEGARDLARTLADARDDVVRAKQRLSKFLLRHGLVYDERNAAGQRRNRWTGDFWAWVGRIDLGDAAAMATLDHYCEHARGRRRQGRARGEGQVAGPAAQVEADLRRAQMPQGHRRGHRGFDRVRGRRLREVRHGVGLRGVGGPGALRALQRRVPIPRRDNQGRQQAPEKAARRGRLALQGSVEVAERPGQGAGSRRSDQATRQRGREAARRQAPLHGRCG